MVFIHVQTDAFGGLLADGFGHVDESFRMDVLRRE